MPKAGEPYGKWTAKVNLLQCRALDEVFVQLDEIRNLLHRVLLGQAPESMAVTARELGLPIGTSADFDEVCQKCATDSAFLAKLVGHVILYIPPIDFSSVAFQGPGCG